VAVAARLARRDLAGRTIDVHAHLGVSLKAYALGEYPYAATAEGLAALQSADGVDASVVFPFTADLFFDPERLRAGECVPAARPASPAPYAAGNALLLREVHDFCPELAGRFLPFVSFDPGREVPGQLRALSELAARYPVYGVKVNGVLCQSRLDGLLGAGRPLMDWAAGQGLPVLLHVSALADEYSHVEQAFRLVEARPETRFCLAHGLLFHRRHLERAAALSNCWVDTAAMKIQVELVGELAARGEIPRGELLDADFSDHLDVMRRLCAMLPGKVAWGSDAPAYAYICRRKQGEGRFQDFSYKATFADEVAALECLDPELRPGVGGGNALDFIFGRE